ncbi:hypothetical protein ACFV5N_08610 [Streptomyces sp. NPDC059853]|uniref:hypothetical protein n=1 Tax=Streptomyces sp. NPDC059853 TaxID=3346973 RepID=UPI00365EC7A2
MTVWSAAAGVMSAVLLAVPAAPVATAAEGAAGAPEPFVIEDERITESSGLAASVRHPGVYWTHNDSGYGPYLYAVDSATGRTVATLTLQGAEMRDVEAIHFGPDGALYVGDIGDNFDGGWDEVWIYRVPEPAVLADATVVPDVYRVRYDDGPRDAESLMVHPETGRVYIASKKRKEPGALYAGPETLSTTEVNTFERVADIDLWMTDGAFSPDGTRLVLRGYFTAHMYRWTDEGLGERVRRQLLVPVQPQGESVTFTPDGRYLMYGSEGEDSEVVPVELKGELLPESLRAGDGEQSAEDGGGGDEGGDGAEAPPAAGPAETSEESDTFTRLVVGFALGTVLVVALRRLLFSRGRSR